MKIAVLSGKGGAGKTFVSVNLAAAAEKATYIDCDVEEPDGRLFLKPSMPQQTSVYTLIPEFNAEKCTGCRKCVDFCRFHALAFIKNLPKVFPEVCHACGGCSLVCPEGAATEKQRAVGKLETGRWEQVSVITGILDLGEASAVPVIKAALHKGRLNNGLVIIDCPPGSGCSVMESVSEADYCILVAEPTAFGLHNFKMVHTLATLLRKPCGVVMNKADGDYMPLIEYCNQTGVKILSRIPYRPQIASINASGEIACLRDPETKVLFTDLLQAVSAEVSA